jgi:hypothetical protein
VGFLAVWIGLSIAVGIAASKRDRNGVGWFFLSMLLSPLLGGALVLALGSKPDLGLRKCPQCAEMVQAEAHICRFCRHELEAIPALPRGLNLDPVKVSILVAIVAMFIAWQHFRQ